MVNNFLGDNFFLYDYYIEYILLPYILKCFEQNQEYIYWNVLRCYKLL